MTPQTKQFDLPCDGPLTLGMRADLERFRQRLGHDPEQELAALLMFGMEREQAAAVAYQEDKILDRLEHSALSPPVREAVAQALRHIWKGEEMHARYLHGVLLRQPALGTRLRTHVQRLSGVVGGWTTSVQQLNTWRSVPLARAVAETVEGLGALAGQVPSEARAGLRYQTLKEYAAFTLDAEWSAAVGYARICELIDEVERRGWRLLILPANIRHEMEVTGEEEADHARFFTLLADALTDDDALREGVDEAELLARLREMARSYATGDQPPGASVKLGQGGRVHVVEGRSPGEKLGRFRELLEASGLRGALAERARELGRDLGDLKVAVKIDLMMGYDRADPSTVVDPELVESLALHLREWGAGEVTVVESRNLYDRFYANRDVESVGRYFGLQSPYYRLVDLSREQERHGFRRGMGHEAIGRTWRDADFRVSFAKLKTHPVEHFALTLWNLHTVTPQDGKFVFGDRVADFHAAVMTVLNEFPVHFGLIDGYASAADGLVGFMACRRSRQPLRFYAGRDLLSVDAVAARHTGVDEPRRSAVYNEATYWFGEPAGGVEVVGPDAPVEPWRSARQGLRGKVLGGLARTAYERLSGRGALFVARVDERAFPPLRGNALLGAARRVVWRVVGA